MFVEDFAGEYARYRAAAEKAMAQVSDEGLNHIAAPDGNSIAMIVRHLSGNLLSRFTDFLTSDGEKAWRDRDGEFVEGTYTRAEVDAAWTAGWDVAAAQLAQLSDDDLTRTITIRGVSLTVHEALARSVTHVAMHVGQIVLLARIVATNDWKWITIPKGKSREHTQSPAHEKAHEQAQAAALRQERVQ